MVWFLKSENDLSSRQNPICVLKELISADQACVDGLMEIQDIEETLFHTVKVPICPKATKASLVIIYNMIKSSKEKSGEIALRFIRMGLIHLILEILVDGDKSVCEKALGVMDSICSLEEGRENAYENALTVPLLVKRYVCRTRQRNSLFRVFGSFAWEKMRVPLLRQCNLGLSRSYW
ncbi:UNVERIFIED_CONTAM: U-box domain-containing protein 21 [Sesamum calycinum]|uniref:U-box domain-containing protein n=1 Tax=Sesamum calycinum TaxID=2727403 RepID=A0AAW2MPX2_9LAMI